MGDLAGWPYWKVVSITGQSGAGTDYQVELEIGDSAGGDFHLEGHCTNFPQDIRITDDDGTTLLDHWVEDITADPIIVHVEVKDDLGSNRDVRVYYGKSGETTASNGANTFLQYHGSASSDFLDSLIVSPTDVAWEGKIKRIGTVNTIYGLANVITSATDDSMFVQANSGGNLRYLQAHNEGTNSGVSESPNFPDNTWVRGKMTCDGTTLRGYIDGNEISTGVTTNLPNENLGLNMWEPLGQAEQEWSFARKYNSPEPAFSGAGAEQTPTVGAIMNQFQRANIGADLYNGVFA